MTRLEQADLRAAPTGRDSVVTRAVLRFAMWSVVALVALSVGIVMVSQQVARAQALTDAREQTDRLANLVIAPLVDSRVRDQDTEALIPLERVLDTRLDEGSMRRVKLWAADGSIIWSDERALIGESYELPGDVQALFGTRRVVAEVSDLGDAENVNEREEGQLLEVYAGAIDRDGDPFVFEAYLSADGIERDREAIIAGTLPIAIGALLLLQIAMLPLALSLARRVRSSEAARYRMTAHALQASMLEQRRLAQELHDGVIQDLAGVGFTLPGLKRHLPNTPEGHQAASTLELMRGLVQKGVAALRTMMIEVYPPDLAEVGLASAVEDLADRGELHDVDVACSFSGDLDVPLPAARLVYRVVREGLHNVYKHSGASRAQVRIDRTADNLTVTVTDDGTGLPAGDLPVAEGHLGLRLLRESLADAGGDLSLTTLVGQSGEGAQLVARLPIGRG